MQILCMQIEKIGNLDLNKKLIVLVQIKVIEKIKEYGGRKTTKIHNIKLLVKPKSLKSKDKKHFLQL